MNCTGCYLSGCVLCRCVCFLRDLLLELNCKLVMTDQPL